MANVLLGLPRLGQVEAESALSAYVHATSQHRVKVIQHNSSLLANGFNVLFTAFMNDPSHEYFVLHHADIFVTTPNWLDVMIGQLEEYHGDVIHAVSPIKDSRGLTSTAVGNVEFKWGARRLTLKEAHLLPVTFDTEDVLRLPGPWLPNSHLLPNTAVLVIKRRNWIYEFPGFCITDGIVKSEGTYSPVVEPEDWAFGRWCAANFVRVLGTTAVELEHYGRVPFVNKASWGHWSVDEAFCNGFDNNTGSLKGPEDTIPTAGDSGEIRLAPSTDGKCSQDILQVGA